jgi:AcrR family transcriptional regulator
MPERPNPRRRSSRAQAAIFAAARELAREQGYGGVTIEGIAARAGVGKQTIYRWWSSKGALLLDVFLEAIVERIGGAGDVRDRVRATAAILADDDIGPRIAELVGAAQHDPVLARELAARLVRPARASNLELLRDTPLRPGVDPDVVADALFGPIWFRLLITKDELSPAYVDALVDAVLSGAAPHVADGDE